MNLQFVSFHDYVRVCNEYVVVMKDVSKQRAVFRRTHVYQRRGCLQIEYPPKLVVVSKYTQWLQSGIKGI